MTITKQPVKYGADRGRPTVATRIITTLDSRSRMLFQTIRSTVFLRLTYIYHLSKQFIVIDATKIYIPTYLLHRSFQIFMHLRGSAESSKHRPLFV